MMPEIRYTLKARYGYVQEWEFESEQLEELDAIVSIFAEFLKKPIFEDIDIVIEPYIVVEEEEKEDE